MDIKAVIEKAVSRLKDNPAMIKQFDKEPVKVLESIIGMDLPDDKIEPVIAGIKAKLAAGNVADGISKLGSMFRK